MANRFRTNVLIYGLITFALTIPTVLILGLLDAPPWTVWGVWAIGAASLVAALCAFTATLLASRRGDTYQTC